MRAGPRTEGTDGDDPRRFVRGRFARVGRVVPVAVLQITGTLLASRWAPVAGGGPVTGPPWARGVAAGIEPVTVGPAAVVLLVAGVLVLPWRWRSPRTVLVVTLATTIGYAALVSPRGPFVAALTMALANAWLRGHRWWAGAAAGVAVAVLPTADWALGRSPALDLGAVTLAIAWATVTLAVSELARVRIERVGERRRQRAEADRQRAADERVRIARELHDSVAHSMSLINLQAGVALHLGADLPDQTRDSLVHIRDSSREALVELRTILGVLRSVDGAAADGRPERSPTPGLDRVPELVERARAAGVDVDLAVVGDPASVGGATDRNAFRIVQESVTNVMKHAPGHRVAIGVTIGPDVVELAVDDRTATDVPTGGGTAPLLGPTGNGIIGMRERATAVGGTLSAGPNPSGGWTVRARLPVTDPDPAPAGSEGRP